MSRSPAIRSNRHPGTGCILLCRAVLGGLGLLLAMNGGCSDAPLSPTQAKPGAGGKSADVRIMGRKSEDAPAPTIDPMRIETRDDIVRVHQFWSQDPWIKDPSTGRVTGFSVATYFVSSMTEKGAFVSGDIQVMVYWLHPTPNGDYERMLAYQWDLNETQASSFRVRKKAILGYYYGLVLKWPETLDLSGKQIEVQITYRRSDGGIVRSSPRGFRIESPLRTRASYTEARR